MSEGLSRAPWTVEGTIEQVQEEVGYGRSHEARNAYRLLRHWRVRVLVARWFLGTKASPFFLINRISDVRLSSDSKAGGAKWRTRIGGQRHGVALSFYKRPVM